MTWQTSAGDWVALHLKMAANSLAVINKPVKVAAVLRLHSTLFSTHWSNRRGLGAWVKTSNQTRWSNLQSQPAGGKKKKHIYNQRLYSQKRVISKCNKDGDNNTATQSKGHSMRLPWVHKVATTNIFGGAAQSRGPSVETTDRRSSAVKYSKQRGTHTTGSLRHSSPTLCPTISFTSFSNGPSPFRWKARQFSAHVGDWMLS